MSTKLIVGLGNYPKEYYLTRHNVGFLAIDYFCENGNFTQWNENKKMLCDITKGIFFNQECILIKPNTYMNLSGNSVVKVMNFFKIPAKNIIVIHDEIDLSFGTIKITQSRNSAGHNGIKSINSIINDVYNRIRVGIGRPKDSHYDISDYVLGKFNQEEQEKLPIILKQVFNELGMLLNK